MSSAACNKCRAAPPVVGDSWCLSCSALEAIASELKGRWGSVELRRLAADQLVEQAKSVKTLRILPLRLRFEGEDKSGSKHTSSPLGATAKARGATPPPPKAPPVARETSTKAEVVETPEHAAEESESDEESEYTYEECSEEPEVETCVEPLRKPPVEKESVTPQKGAGSGEAAESKKRKRCSEEVRAVPVAPKKEKKEKRHSSGHKRRRGRRGGSKHQQSSKRRHDPEARIHRRKSVQKLAELKAQDKPLSPREKEWRR